MNIFFLDEEPKLAAQYQCDKHVIKMILESAQLLCTCHHIVGTSNLPSKFYKSTHINHPCSKWIRQRQDNYDWLATHALYLCEEYSFRYNKIHACTNLIEWLFTNLPSIRKWRYDNYLNDIEDEEDRYYPALTYNFGEYWFSEQPPQCMPDKFKVDNNPVQAYRNYYFYDKRININCQWKIRNKPEWFIEMENHGTGN